MLKKSRTRRRLDLIRVCRWSFSIVQQNREEGYDDYLLNQDDSSVSATQRSNRPASADHHRACWNQKHVELRGLERD